MVDQWLADYSAKTLTAQQLKDGMPGVIGTIRYVDAPANMTAKHVTPAEYANHKAAGFKQWLFFEVGRSDAAGGFAQGVAYARRAVAGAQYVGAPIDPAHPIIMVCDRHLVEKGLATIAVATWRSFLDGAASVIGKANLGAYGYFDAMDAAQGHASVFVQCGSRSDVRAFVNAWQDNTTQPVVSGVQTDRNKLLIDVTNGVVPNVELTDLVKLVNWGSDHSAVLSVNDVLAQDNARLTNVETWVKANADLGAKVDALTAKLSALTVGQVDPVVLTQAISDALGAILPSVRVSKVV
jgi:hypothetical protein